MIDYDEMFAKICGMMEIKNRPRFLYDHSEDNTWGGRCHHSKEMITMQVGSYNPKNNDVSKEFLKLKIPNKFIPVHIISHELQHHKQYVSERLKVFNVMGSVSSMWTETGYTLNYIDTFCMSEDEYYNLPWEKEANEVAAQICRKFRF